MTEKGDNADEEEFIKIWDIMKRKQLYSLRLENAEDYVKSLDLHPNGNLLAIGFSYANSILWDIVNNRQVILPEETEELLGIYFAMNGKILIEANRSGVVEMWNVDELING